MYIKVTKNSRAALITKIRQSPVSLDSHVTNSKHSLMNDAIFLGTEPKVMYLAEGEWAGGKEAQR
jgi:hypothetical protein